jgi:hypothetical protein
MRTKEQLKERIKWYKDAISQMEQSDAEFPDSPVHENDIKSFKDAIRALEHIITKV